MSAYLGRAGAAHPDSPIVVSTRFDDPVHTIALSGEVDLASRNLVVQACTASAHIDVAVDLSGVTFMDCAGFSAFVVATAVLERRGGRLMLTGAAGEPRRLLGLIDELEQERGSPVSVRVAGDPSIPTDDSVPGQGAVHSISRDLMDRWISAMAGGDAAAASRIMLEARSERQSLVRSGLIGSTDRPELNGSLGEDA